MSFTSGCWSGRMSSHKIISFNFCSCRWYLWYFFIYLSWGCLALTSCTHAWLVEINSGDVHSRSICMVHLSQVSSSYTSLCLLFEITTVQNIAMNYKDQDRDCDVIVIKYNFRGMRFQTSTLSLIHFCKLWIRVTIVCSHHNLNSCVIPVFQRM